MLIFIDKKWKNDFNTGRQAFENTLIECITKDYSTLVIWIERGANF